MSTLGWSHRNDGHGCRALTSHHFHKRPGDVPIRERFWQHLLPDEQREQQAAWRAMFQSGSVSMKKRKCAMEVFDTVRTVLAVRQFQDKPVPESVVHQIVEAGHLTAS